VVTEKRRNIVVMVSDSAPEPGNIELYVALTFERDRISHGRAGRLDAHHMTLARNKDRTSHMTSIYRHRKLDRAILRNRKRSVYKEAADTCIFVTT